MNKNWKPVATRSMEARERCIKAATVDAVTRYVVTHIGRGGLRTMAHAAQGRNTYAIPEEAQAWIDAAMKNNSLDRLNNLFGLPLEVRPCKCYAGHFDPVGVYFPDPVDEMLP